MKTIFYKYINSKYVRIKYENIYFFFNCDLIIINVRYSNPFRLMDLFRRRRGGNIYGVWAFVNYTVCQPYHKTTIPSVNAYRLSTIPSVNHTICQPYHLSNIPFVNHTICQPYLSVHTIGQPYNIYIYCIILHILSSSSHKLKHQNLHFFYLVR